MQCIFLNQELKYIVNIIINLVNFLKKLILSAMTKLRVLLIVKLETHIFSSALCNYSYKLKASQGHSVHSVQANSLLSL